MSERSSNQDFGHSIDCPVDGKPPNKICTCGAEKRAREAIKAERERRSSNERLGEKTGPSELHLERYVKVFIQGQILFIGDHWFSMSEAERLRDWLNKVLP